MKRILFITGTRADYGKIKSILKKLEHSKKFTPYIFVCGMHLIDKFGGTYKEIIRDKYKHIKLGRPSMVTDNMSQNIANLITELNEFIKSVEIDMIVVHGDRTDALAGAIIGSLNNIRVSHIEGGEISGTIDESMRHAISKLANYHFVSTEKAKMRLIQMGEDNKSIYVIGSPDIDLMFSKKLPSLDKAKFRYNINFDNYAIALFHPVTTEFNLMDKHINDFIKSLIKSNHNYIVIYPNNDLGSDIIIRNYKTKLNQNKFKIFPSIRFEYFLTLLKNSEFIIGNSSCGVREACIYGVKCIDIGTRQAGRISSKTRNVLHSDYSYVDICKNIKSIYNNKNIKFNEFVFGHGNSAEMFYSIICKDKFWKKKLQKRFVDLD